MNSTIQNAVFILFCTEGARERERERTRIHPHYQQIGGIFFFFLINCWSSVIASVVLPQVVQSPLSKLGGCPNQPMGEKERGGKGREEERDGTNAKGWENELLPLSCDRHEECQKKKR